MAWRVVAIENPARLSLRDNQLVIAQDVEATLHACPGQLWHNHDRKLTNSTRYQEHNNCYLRRETSASQRAFAVFTALAPG